MTGIRDICYTVLVMTIEIISAIIGVTIAAFILNLPFGYLRGAAKKFSFKWLFFIHAPIPFVFVLRNMAGLGYGVIPVLLVGAVAGQVVGARMNKAGSGAKVTGES